MSLQSQVSLSLDLRTFPSIAELNHFLMIGLRRAFSLALTCFEGSVKIRNYRVTKLSDSGDVIDLYSEEVALATELFNLGNVQMQLGDFSQAMGNMIQSRDLRWRHVGGGSIDKIIEEFSSEKTVDEDELLGLGESFQVDCCQRKRQLTLHLQCQPTVSTTLASCLISGECISAVPWLTRT